MENNLYKKRSFTPMLLSEVKKPFDDPDYLFELKYDGIRALIFASPKEVRIQSRNHHDITYLYPELQSIQKIVKKECIFDGEIVLMEGGVPSFLALQKRAHLKQKNKILEQSINHPVLFMVFDLLYENKNLIDFSLLERKKILETYSDTSCFIKSKYMIQTGKKLFQLAKKFHLEGIVAKKMNSTYEINTRTKSWLKIKNFKEQDFYIVGYEKKVGALLLYVAQKKKEAYFFSGKVLLYENHPAYQKILAVKKKNYPILNTPEEFTTILPKYQATIIFLEKNKNGNLRHPVFKSLKE